MHPARTILVTSLTALLLLAGCLGEDTATTPSPQPAEEPAITEAEPSGLSEGNTSTEPPLARLPVHWNATTGTDAWVCETEGRVGCVGERLQPGSTGLYLEGQAGNLTTASLEMTWDPIGPWADQMGLGLMVMAPCEGGCDWSYEEVTGTSPLTLALEDQAWSLGDEDAVIHLYVWQPALFHHQPPLVTYGDIDQPFQVHGTLTVQP